MRSSRAASASPMRARISSPHSSAAAATRWRSDETVRAGRLLDARPVADGSLPPAAIAVPAPMVAVMVVAPVHGFDALIEPGGIGDRDAAGGCREGRGGTGEGDPHSHEGRDEDCTHVESPCVSRRRGMKRLPWSDVWRPRRGSVRLGLLWRWSLVDRLAPAVTTNAIALESKRRNQNGAWPTHSLLVHRLPPH